MIARPDDSYRAEGIALAEARAASIPLPADFDAMLRAVPERPVSADMRWMRDPYLAEVDETEEVTS